MAEALITLGWRVLAQNWKAAGGEIDLIVIRDRAVRFVEVKARVDAAIDGEEAITPEKQRRIGAAANAWWMANEVDAEEFAVLVAVVDVHEGETTIRWIDDAFDTR